MEMDPLAPSKLVVSMDPGRKVSFVAAAVYGSRPQVKVTLLAWGKVPIFVNPKFEPSSILTNPWEASRCFLEKPSSLRDLIVAFGGQPHFVWEQQRGYLDLCVGVPFGLYVNSEGHGMDIIPPNEKYHRLGVSKDKRQSVAYAATYFANQNPALSQYLTDHPLEEVHDIADASLLHIMWLEEHCHMPILGSLPRPAPSGCSISKTLASIYQAVNVNDRKGSNITRRIAVTARIAASSAKFLSRVPESSGSTCSRLTRQFLRNLGMPPSEAADLCSFFWMVINSIQAPFVGLVLDLDGITFSIYKVKGKKSAAAAAVVNCEAFKSIMVYKC